MIVFSVWPSAERKARPLRMSSCGDVPGAASDWPSSVYESSPAASVKRRPARRRRARHDRGRLVVVRRREAAGEVLHDLRDLGRAPAGRVVVARLRRIRLVVADRDVVEVAAAGRLRELVDLVVREAEALARRGGLDARPDAEPERRGEARPRALRVGAAVVVDQRGRCRSRRHPRSRRRPASSGRSARPRRRPARTGCRSGRTCSSSRRRRSGSCRPARSSSCRRR